MATDIVFLEGCQFNYVNERYKSSGLGNWGIVSTFADIEIKSNFPNAYERGTYAFLKSVSTCVLAGGSVLDDQSSGYDTAAILFAPSSVGQARLSVRGGYIGAANTHSPVIRIGGKDCVVDLDAPVFSANATAYLFSFQGNNAGLSRIPAMLHGHIAAGSAPIIDPGHPGPVIVPEQELSGPFTIVPGADADVTIDPGISNDSLWREHILVAGAWGSGHNVIWPANPRKLYSGKNTSGFTATLKRAGSSSPVSVTNGARFLVQDNGTDLVSLL